ncbi:MAG: cation diffusion facilitator family transporter [Gemmatimonadota bacterium]|nr:cation diffusion facilitator family transporter [Gemmatimonadota bacterium]
MAPPLQSSALRLVLAINAAMFVAEFGAGWLAESTGLIADSFDMLADALVYGLSLAAVSRSDAGRARTATVSGILQVTLGLGALTEVARRLIGGSEPEPSYMVVVAAVALVANAWCLRIVARHKDEGVHMRASYIFSQNDVLANVAVIASGLLVAVTGAAAWDLIVGAGIGLLVLSGGYRILRAAAQARSRSTSDGDDRDGG